MIYLRNKDTSEIHCLDDDRRSKEQCNVDQIRFKEELEEKEALQEVSEYPEHACEHCWP